MWVYIQNIHLKVTQNVFLYLIQHWRPHFALDSIFSTTSF